jgi:hypothetical protein
LQSKDGTTRKQKSKNIGDDAALDIFVRKEQTYHCEKVDVKILIKCHATIYTTGPVALSSTSPVFISFSVKNFPAY